MKTRDELIQDYIDRVLTDADQKEFDAIFAGDESFREELNLQQQIHASLANRLISKEDDLRRNLVLVEKDYRSKQKGTVVHLRKWIIPIVAAACLLVLAKVFLFPAASYYEIPEMRSEIVRGQEDPKLLTYEEAVKAFNAKEYAQSSSVLQSLTDENPNVVQYAYYLGLSKLGEGKYRESVGVLKEVANGESIFQQDANYYVAVAYHELGQDDEAKERLAKIQTTSKIYPKAKELLKRLK